MLKLGCSLIVLLIKSLASRLTLMDPEIEGVIVFISAYLPEELLRASKDTCHLSTNVFHGKRQGYIPEGSCVPCKLKIYCIPASTGHFTKT